MNAYNDKKTVKQGLIKMKPKISLKNKRKTKTNIV